MTEKQTCPVCGEKYWNRGHHAEACTGPPPAVEIAKLKHALSACVPWVAASGRGLAQEALIDACALLGLDAFDWSNHPDVLRARLELRGDQFARDNDGA